MTVIVCDIGGTHARLGLADAGGRLRETRKIKVADYASLPALLDWYAGQTGHAGRVLRIATAASWPDADGGYSLANKNLWRIVPSDLATLGWVLDGIENDFATSVRALRVIAPADVRVLHAGRADPAGTKAMVGPGTGLGLGYLHPSGAVQPTFGGHMAASAMTDEQRDVLACIGRACAGTVHYEYVASGWGLPYLARAVTGQAMDAQAVLDNAARGDEKARATVRLLHEFWGVFCHQAALFGHATGGVYFHGGLVDRLDERGLFMPDTIRAFMVVEPAAVVKTMLSNLPLLYVPDPYLTLKGLMVP